MTYNQKISEVLKCNAKFQCRTVAKVRWYWAAVLPPS